MTISEAYTPVKELDLGQEKVYLTYAQHPLGGVLSMKSNKGHYNLYGPGQYNLLALARLVAFYKKGLG
jgi:hypothetical protein